MRPCLPAALHDSPATAKANPKFVLATDGDMLEAEDAAGDNAGFRELMAETCFLGNQP